MIRIISAFLVSAYVLVGASSCCCTSDMEAPPLRPLPQFREIGPVYNEK